MYHGIEDVDLSAALLEHVLQVIPLLHRLLLVDGAVHVHPGVDRVLQLKMNAVYDLMIIVRINGLCYRPFGDAIFLVAHLKSNF
jgi:hypothetical protein